MTPAQFDALAGVERRARDAAGGRHAQSRPSPEPGDGLDWLTLAAMANGRT